MKIIDLDSEKKFSHAVACLERVIYDSEGDFDLIVGIPTGGRFVVDKMFFLTKGTSVCFLSKQRASTKTKAQFNLNLFLPYIPRVINNTLRRIESKYLEFRFLKNKHSLFDSAKNTVHVVSKMQDKIRISRKVLVVDDALDSGLTMLTIVNTLRKENPSLCIKTATINVTFKEPLILPDFFLYKDTIVRYPWSNDVK